MQITHGTLTFHVSLAHVYWTLHLMGSEDQQPERTTRTASGFIPLAYGEADMVTETEILRAIASELDGDGETSGAFVDERPSQ